MLILKYVLQELSPVKVGKMVPSRAMKIKYILPHILQKNNSGITTLYILYLFAIQLFSDFFYQVQISTKYEIIILKSVFLSIALARPGTISPVVRII